MKRCTKCGDEKPEEAFDLCKKGKPERRTECRSCRNASQKAWKAQRKLNPPKPKSEMKRCLQCQEVRDVREFSPDGIGYFRSRCKACEAANRHEKRREQGRNDPTGRFYWPFENESGITVKRCVHCHAEKPLSEFYTNGKTNVKGLTKGRKRPHSKCKDCDKALKKADYDADPERQKDIVRRSARKHPDRVRARHHRWAVANRARLTQYKREQVAADRERYLSYYRLRHIRDAEQERLYRMTRSYELSENQARRRARVLNAPRIEMIDRKTIIERDKWTCYLCLQICTPKNVTLDHVVPLYRGGTHTADNLRVACLSCNCSKGGKLLCDFLK